MKRAQCRKSCSLLTRMTRLRAVLELVNPANAQVVGVNARQRYVLLRSDPGSEQAIHRRVTGAHKYRIVTTVDRFFSHHLTEFETKKEHRSGLVNRKVFLPYCDALNLQEIPDDILHRLHGFFSALFYIVTRFLSPSALDALMERAHTIRHFKTGFLTSQLFTDIGRTLGHLYFRDGGALVPKEVLARNVFQILLENGRLTRDQVYLLLDPMDFFFATSLPFHSDAVALFGEEIL